MDGLDQRFFPGSRTGGCVLRETCSDETG